MANTGAVRPDDESSHDKQTLRADIRFELPNDDCPIASAAGQNIATHMILEDRCYVVSKGVDERTVIEQHERDITGSCPCTVFQRYGCLPEYESASDGRVTVRTYLDDRETLQELVHDLQATSEYVSLQRLIDLDEEHYSDLRSVDLSVLSATQEETLHCAIDAGYYDDPRRIDFKTLAEELEITKPTLSNRLRIAESKLLVDLLEE